MLCCGKQEITSFGAATFFKPFEHPMSANTSQDACAAFVSAVLSKEQYVFDPKALHSKIPRRQPHEPSAVFAGALPSSALLATSPATSSLHVGEGVATRHRPIITTRLTVRSRRRPTWTTSSGTELSLRNKLIGDVVVASSVTLGVAPFLTVIDKAIVQRAAGTHTIVSSSVGSFLSITRNPVSFVKSPMFLMMWGVYAVTYATANSLKTVSEHSGDGDKSQQQGEAQNRVTKIGAQESNASAPPRSSAAKWGTFLGTTVVNSGSSIIKDKAYAKMFGTTGVATKVPMITYGLWASRDCMVIGSSFFLPEMVGSFLESSLDLSNSNATRIAQFACPVATQLVAGPVQLLGLDSYNRPMTDVPFGQMAASRAKLLASNFLSVVGARVARIAPAYGIGGIGNTHLRNEWRGMLERREEERAVVRTGGNSVMAEARDGLMSLIAQISYQDGCNEGASSVSS